jgi:hypothetical protein
VLRLVIGDGDIFYMGQRGRVFFQGIEEGIDFSGVSLHLDFNVLRGITYPAVQGVFMCKLVDKWSEADTLYDSPGADPGELYVIRLRH